MSTPERLNGHHPPRPAPPRKPAPKELTAEALATGLYAKRGELRALARRHGLTLDELARRSSEPETTRSIASLRRLAEARAGVLLARARADATTLLLALAESAESDETRRRACVDLLKAPAASAPDLPDAPPTDADDAPDEASTRSLLAALERLGRASHRDDATAHGDSAP